MSYHAIIKIPVNPTATDLVLAYGATVAGNTKCLRKKLRFNIFFWHLSLFFLFWDIITSRVLEEMRLASLQLRIWQYFLEVQHLWLCRLIMELQRSMLCQNFYELCSVGGKMICRCHQHVKKIANENSKAESSAVKPANPRAC